MIIKIFGDLFNNKRTRAEIRCLYSGNVARRLSLDPHGNIVVDPLQGPSLVVPADTVLKYEPWVMDRGSLLFSHKDMPGKALKLCGEGDTIHYDDGHKDTIEPAPNLEQHPHEVHLIVHHRNNGSSIPLKPIK